MHIAAIVQLELDVAVGGSETGLDLASTLLVKARLAATLPPDEVDRVLAAADADPAAGPPTEPG